MDGVRCAHICPSEMLLSSRPLAATLMVIRSLLSTNSDLTRAMRSSFAIRIEPRHLEQILPPRRGTKSSMPGKSESRRDRWKPTFSAAMPKCPCLAEVVRRGRLKWIQSSAAGLDHCLTPETIPLRIVVTSASGLFAEAVAEQTLALLLGLFRDSADVLPRPAKARIHSPADARSSAHDGWHRWPGRQRRSHRGGPAAVSHANHCHRHVHRRSGRRASMSSGPPTARSLAGRIRRRHSLCAAQCTDCRA